MLNTTVAVGGNHFNYNVNAVSGTLRKSHPKSKMIIVTLILIALCLMMNLSYTLTDMQ